MIGAMEATRGGGFSPDDDPDSNVKFISNAVWWIRQSIIAMRGFVN